MSIETYKVQKLYLKAQLLLFIKNTGTFDGFEQGLNTVHNVSV